MLLILSLIFSRNIRGFTFFVLTIFLELKDKIEEASGEKMSINHPFFKDKLDVVISDIYDKSIF